MILSPPLRDVARARVGADQREADVLHELREIGGGFAVVAGEFDFTESGRVHLAQRAFEVLGGLVLDGPELDAQRDLAVVVGERSTRHEGPGRDAGSGGHEK